MNLLVCVAIGLVGGVCIGFVLGANSPGRCADCLSNSAERYREGYGEGWMEGVVWTIGLVRTRGLEAKNTWTITKPELYRIEKDALDVGKSNRDGIPG